MIGMPLVIDGSAPHIMYAQRPFSFFCAPPPNPHISAKNATASNKNTGTTSIPPCLSFPQTNQVLVLPTGPSRRLLLSPARRHSCNLTPGHQDAAVAHTVTVNRSPRCNRQGCGISSRGAVHERNSRNTPVWLQSHHNSDSGPARCRSIQIHCLQCLGR